MVVGSASTRRSSRALAYSCTSFSSGSLRTRHPLHIQHRYTENEREMVRDAMHVAEELCHGAGFQILAKHDQMVPPGESIHEMGTCRMGADPKTSVLNKYNQSHDVKNLFVVDGSSFGSGGCQNPTLTILALSMRSAEYMAE